MTKSFPVPFTDHQIEVDTETGTVSVFLNAWNRESSGYPDDTYSFDALRTDAGLMARMTRMLAGGDAAEFERLVAGD